MIDPVQAVTAIQPLQGATQPSPELRSLADRFNSLMARDPDASYYSEQHIAPKGSVAGAFIRAQEAAMRKTVDEVRSFAIDAPHMDLQALASRHIDLTYQIALTQLQFNAGVYLAQSSKSGLQTLMRNQ